MKKHGRGLLVMPDDFEIGQHYTVLGSKTSPDNPPPIAGMAFRLVAMNLPFIVGRLACAPGDGPVTFDSRFLNFMRVSDDYVHAQRMEEGNP